MGFVNLFLLWVGLMIWAAILGRQKVPPKAAPRIVWGAGIGLGLSLLAGAWGLVSQMGEPAAGGLSMWAMNWSGRAGFSMMMIGYLAMATLTWRWWRSAEPDA